MRKKTSIVIWCIIGLLCILGIGAFTFSAIRFSSYVIFGIAFVVLCFQILHRLSRKKPHLAKILQRILTAGVCVLCLAAAITEGFILHASHGSKETDSDYLIVLGAGVNGTAPSLSLQERLDAAYDYLVHHPDTICVVSGGQGNGEDITEAACMYNYLTLRGISPERILMEDKSTSTHENLLFSTAVITTDAGTMPENVAILSAEYHLFRAKLIARDQGLNPILVPARTSWLSLRINYFLREIAGVWYFLIFGG